MHIWIDGDACPKQIKEIVFRASSKRQVYLSIVANHFLSIPSSPYIKRVVVEAGFDSADQYIVSHLAPKDLVITADILLAEQVIIKQGFALSPRGVLFNEDNIKQIVAMRHMNESLRSQGLIQGGQAGLQQKEIVIFSNHLDKWITRFMLG